jgi:hypothetical protein
MIKVTCNCGATLNVKDEYAGKRGKCPRCGNGVLIPMLEPEEDLEPFDSPFKAAFTPLSIASSLNDSIDTNARSPSLPPPVAPPRVNPQQNSFENESNLFAVSQNSSADPATNFAPVKKPLPQLKVVNNCVVGKSPMTLPRYCIKCGKPIAPSEIETMEVNYTPPSAVLKAFLHRNATLMTLLRKPCVVYAGLCPLHRKRRILNRVIFVLMLLIGLALFVSPFFLHKDAKGNEGIPALLTGIGVIVAAFLFLVLRNQLLSAKNYDGDCSVESIGRVKGNFTIKGFCQEFLAKLET